MKIYRALSVLGIFGILLFLTLRPGLEGDTQALVDGSFHGLSCMKVGQWIHCPEEVGPFTIFQYLPSWFLEIFGAGKSLVIHVLAYLSMVTGLVSFLVMFHTLNRKSRALAWTGILLLGSGFWLRYLNLSSGEMLASFF